MMYTQKNKLKKLVPHQQNNRKIITLKFYHIYTVTERDIFNIGKLCLNSYDLSIFVRNFRNFLNNFDRVILCFKRNKMLISFLIKCIQFSMQYITTTRSSRSQMIFEIGVLKVGNIHRLEACNFIKKILRHRCFPVNIAKCLRKFYLKNNTGGCFCTLNSSGI